MRGYQPVLTGPQVFDGLPFGDGGPLAFQGLVSAAGGISRQSARLARQAGIWAERLRYVNAARSGASNLGAWCYLSAIMWPVCDLRVYGAFHRRLQPALAPLPS